MPQKDNFVCVYAICKNEKQFVDRWMDSMSEADLVVVLDTGSEDGTVEALRARGALVTVETISPWRFDTARNHSMELVPEDADICVCTDLDEVFHPGWRSCMEKAWGQGVSRLRYRYTWNFNPDGSEGYVFWIDKVHARHGFQWVNPVHEVLQYINSGAYVTQDAEGVQLDHHADPSKSRGQYLPLLELAVRERPEDDRNMHYLGREYMFHRMWPACERTLLRHLAMPQAVWADERCASMRFLARAVLHQGRGQEAMCWLMRAAAEAPHLREPWLDASELAAKMGYWAGSLFFARRALEITERGRTYINEAESWGAKPYDLAAVASYYLGLYDDALAYGKEACGREPENERLAENLRFYEEYVPAADREKRA